MIARFSQLRRRSLAARADMQRLRITLNPFLFAVVTPLGETREQATRVAGAASDYGPTSG